MSRKIIFKICFLVIIWSVIILGMIGVSILFNLINLDMLFNNKIPPEVELEPNGEPNFINIMSFVLPLCFGLALSMRLFDKELTKSKKGVEK